MVRDKSFYKTIFTVALPAAFYSLITQLVNVADNMMVSSLGTEELAGVAQANSITAFFSMTILGLISGSRVLISQYWGKRDMARIGQIFSLVVSLVSVLAIAVIVLATSFPQTILSLVIRDAAVIQTVTPYFRIVCLSYLPFAAGAALVGMLRAVEVVEISLVTAITAFISNVGLNYVLIFGKLGFPALGVQGAAIATVCARMIELIVACIYTFRVQKVIEVRPRQLFARPQGWLVRDYCKFGVPVGLTDMQWALIGLLKAAIVGGLGATIMAANSIANSMMDLGCLFTFALAEGACVVIGKTVGAKDYARTREYSRTIQIMFLGIGLVVAAVVYLLRGGFVWIYQAQPAVSTLARDMIAIGAVTLIGTTYHASCFVGINRGAGDSRFVMIVDMICGWLVVLPLSYLAGVVWKVDLKWMFLFLRIDQCFKWIVAFFRLRGDKWIKNVTRD